MTTGTVRLPALPSVRSVLPGALASAVRNRTATSTLPDVEYRASLDTGTPHVVDTLTAYQHLLGEPASWRLPAGFVHTLGFPLAAAMMADRQFPLPLLGMVHIANRATMHTPVTCGDVVELRTHAQDLRPHRRGRQVDIVTQAWLVPDAGGPVLAYEGTSTYLAKSREAGVPGEPGAEVPTGPVGEVGEEAEASTGVGQREKFPVPTARWRIDARTTRAYAAVSGDLNPIHTSALAARAFGFRRRIAHGMYCAARALAATGITRRPAYTWTVEFGKPVLLPATVNVAVTATGGGFDYAGWSDPARFHFRGRVEPG